MKVTIEEGITSIGNYAFNNYDSLVEVIISSSVNSIGTQAFSNCNSLSTMKYYGLSSPSYYSKAFFNTNSLKQIEVPTNYESTSFCGKPISKTLVIE